MPLCCILVVAMYFSNPPRRLLGFFVLCASVVVVILVVYRVGQKDAIFTFKSDNLRVSKVFIPDRSMSKKSRRKPGGKPGSTRLTQYKRRHVISQDYGVPCDSCTHKLPTALIIGVKKGGTGSLLHFLGLHPEIAVTDKEVRFFLYNKTYRSGLNWYRKNLPCACEDQLVIEKTPRYFSTAYVPQRVFKMNNGMKMILMLRDPVERAISDFGHTKWADEVYRKRKWNETFEDLLVDSRTGAINTSHCIIDRSVYYDSMINWLKWFDRKQFLILSSEEFVKHPHDALQKAEKFLNLKSFFDQKMFYYDRKTGFYCYLMHGKPRCMPDSKGLPHVKVQTKVKRQLGEYYRQRNHDFNKLVNESFVWSDQSVR